MEKDLITADLDAMGATEIILAAIKTRLPAALIPLLESLVPSLGATSNSLLARIGIDEIVIEAGAITGKLRIHPASND